MPPPRTSVCPSLLCRMDLSRFRARRGRLCRVGLLHINGRRSRSRSRQVRFPGRSGCSSSGRRGRSPPSSSCHAGCSTSSPG
ncbi:hypothetical protein FMEAI12_4030011 [Parafrankia sp. Ea1.12]|nr:hypothetical protein FMEAI12_4030011 [Parafrankia sp. Ea1.12]